MDDSPITPNGSVVFSACGKFRYHLAYRWSDGPTLVWIMLNPSSVDADPRNATTRKCIRFTQDFDPEAGGIEIVNLFGFRSPSPKAMLSADDPVGPDNDAWIERTTASCGMVVCAWGPLGNRFQRAQTVLSRLGRADLHCLGLTKDGSPQHPLMVPYSRGVQPWDGSISQPANSPKRKNSRASGPKIAGLTGLWTPPSDSSLATMSSAGTPVATLPASAKRQMTVAA